MMTRECNIVRDLLPLYLDGAISEDGRKLVEEHTALCEGCAKERREMMLALPENREPQAEQVVLAKAAKGMRRKHMRRGALLTVTGVLLGILLLFGARWTYYYLRYDHHVNMALDAYDVYLSTLESGKLVCSMVEKEMGVPFDWGYGWEPAADGSGEVIKLHMQHAIFPVRNGKTKVGTHVFEWLDGKIYDRSGTQIVIIYREGPHGEEELLYQYDEDESLVQPASQEMEEYYKLNDDFDLYYDMHYASPELKSYINGLLTHFGDDSVPFELIASDADAFHERIKSLYDQILEARDLIPEWQ